MWLSDDARASVRLVRSCFLDLGQWGAARKMDPPPRSVEGLASLPDVRVKRKCMSAGSKSKRFNPSGKTPPAPSMGSQRSQIPFKKCVFMCGHTSHSDDDQDPSSCMRWAYSDGTGSNCWYCERTWMSCFAHLHSDRNTFRKLISRDKREHDKFLVKRKEFLERRLL